MKMVATGEAGHNPMLTFGLGSMKQSEPDNVNDVGFFVQTGDDAARIDGAMRVQHFWRVTVPLVQTATAPVTVTTLSLIGGLAVVRFDLGDNAGRARVIV